MKITMKVSIVAIVIIAALVQTEADISKEVHITAVRFNACLKEMNINFGKEPFNKTLICIKVCYEEIREMVMNGKYLVGKYVKQYLKSYPAANSEQVATLVACIHQANKEEEKCNVARSLRACELENFDFLYNV